jgi:hypothetical protein
LDARASLICFFGADVFTRRSPDGVAVQTNSALVGGCSQAWRVDPMAAASTLSLYICGVFSK